MKNFLIQIFSGIDGSTLDPARVIGYGASIVGVLAFVFNSVWSVTHGAAFDSQAYGIGLGAVLAGVMAVGVGVGAKSHTEPSA